MVFTMPKILTRIVEAMAMHTAKYESAIAKWTTIYMMSKSNQKGVSFILAERQPLIREYLGTSSVILRFTIVRRVTNHCAMFGT
jgi:hypothetical protein